MARKRFQTILGSGFLNGVAFASPTSLQEPITGLPQMSGLYVGDFDEISRAEAAKLSDPAVGTLFEGSYQFVMMDPGASFGANLKRGQILFWKLNGVYPAQVTNVEPVGVSMIAGFYIGPVGTNAKAPSLANPFFFMQCFAPGLATLQLKTALSNAAPAIGDSIYTAGAGAGADNATADDVSPVTLANASNYIGRFIGVAEVAPAGGALLAVEVRGGHLRF